MSDLTYRLLIGVPCRVHKVDDAYHVCGEDGWYCLCCTDLREAADRIERLEAFVAKVRFAAGEADASDTADAVDQALAELDK